MSDPKRSDLSVVTETEFGITWDSVSDAEFDAIAKDAGYVKVWEDCQTCNGLGDMVVDHSPKWQCLTCDGSGKVLADHLFYAGRQEVICVAERVICIPVEGERR